MPTQQQKLDAVAGLPCSLRELAGALAEEYAGLVPHVAHQVASKLPPHVDFDDLVSAGYEGLLQAALRFDPSRGFQFSTYAPTRIRGEMIDQLRDRDPTSRAVRKKANELFCARAAIAHALGRWPTEDELRERLGWSEQELELASREIVERSTEEVIAEEREGRQFRIADRLAQPGKASRVRRDQWFEQLTASLFFEERVMLWLYYLRGINMREVGLLFGLSESRVSQELSRLARDLAERIEGADAFATVPQADTAVPRAG